MLAKIEVNNCLDVSNFVYSFSSNCIIDKNINIIRKALLNIYNGSNDDAIIDNNKESEIKLYFYLNNNNIEYISSFLLLDSNYLVVFKLINNDSVTYFINDKEVDFKTIKFILNHLIDNRRIIYSLYNDESIIDNYLLNNNGDYCFNNDNYLKLQSLRKELNEELNIILNNNEENIDELLAIKKEIEDFDLEKGEISYITNLYQNMNNFNYDEIINSFENNLSNIDEDIKIFEQLDDHNEVNDLIDSYYKLKDNFFKFKENNLNNNKNDEYIVKRYNELVKFMDKYGDSYSKINEYYNNVVSKINYYKYSLNNKMNLVNKIENIDYKINETKSVLDNIKHLLIDKLIFVFNNLVSKFDNNIKLIYDNSFKLTLNEEVLTYEEIKEYDNYNLITFLLNTIFLIDSDKTIIVDDDFSNNFNNENMLIYIKLLNNLKNVIVLSSKNDE